MTSDIARFAVIYDGWGPMDSIGVLKSGLRRAALREKDLALSFRRMRIPASFGKTSAITAFPFNNIQGSQR